MATKKKTISKITSETGAEQVSFSVEPGTKIKITLDVGKVVVDGKVPLTVNIEQIRGEAASVVEAGPVEPNPPFDRRMHHPGARARHYLRHPRGPFAR